MHVASKNEDILFVLSFWLKFQLMTRVSRICRSGLTGLGVFRALCGILPICHSLSLLWYGGVETRLGACTPLMRRSESSPSIYDENDDMT